MTPEGRVKTRLRRALKNCGVDLWQYWPVPRGYGMATLDCLLCVRGHFVAVETKAPGKKLTPRQKGTWGDIAAAGGNVFQVENDEDISRVIGWIQLIGDPD